MEVKVETSKKFSLDSKDFWKGLYMYVGSAVCMSLLVAVDEDLNFRWKLVLYSAFAAAITYLLKNFFAPSQIVIKQDKNPDGPIKTMDV